MKGPAADELPRPSSSDTEFVQCYRQHYPRLVKALVMGGADVPVAEDVAQEAFARALVRWKRISKGDNPPGYVYRVAFRLLYRVRRPDLLVDGDAEQHSTSHESGTALRMTVDAMLAAMPPRRRSCAVLCLVLGFTSRDAAELLGMADGTVRKHLELARRDLRLGM